MYSVYYSGNITGIYKLKENMQNGTISELYTDDKEPPNNPNDIRKSAKNFYT